MPDAYDNNNPPAIGELHCWQGWLVWERVWSTQTAPDAPKLELGRFRLCVRRFQSQIPPWATDADRHRHRLPRCEGCKQYFRDTPLTRDADNPDRFHQAAALSPSTEIIEDVPF